MGCSASALRCGACCSITAYRVPAAPPATHSVGTQYPPPELATFQPG
jgi:hypothetical protein